MATGDTLLTLNAQAALPPAANPGSIDTVAGGSTPAETVPVIDLDATMAEYVDVHGVMPQHYGGGAIDVHVKCSMTSDNAGSNKVRLEGSFRKLDGEQLSAAHTYVYQGASVTVPSAATQTVEGTIVFTALQVDSVAVGEEFIFRLCRDPAHADDNATGDCEVRTIEMREA
jgi:hypothetical protein